MKFLIITILVIFLIIVCLLLGKTKITFDPFYFHMERPLTVIFFIAALIAGLFNK
jgi:hypothetical protein